MTQYDLEHRYAELSGRVADILPLIATEDELRDWDARLKVEFSDLDPWIVGTTLTAKWAKREGLDYCIV
jgi:hypothetical protein